MVPNTTTQCRPMMLPAILARGDKTNMTLCVSLLDKIHGSSIQWGYRTGDLHKGNDIGGVDDIWLSLPTSSKT